MTKKLSIVKKYTGPTIQDTLPNNRAEWLVNAIFLTERAINKDRSSDSLSFQLERLNKELKTLQKKK